MVINCKPPSIRNKLDFETRQEINRREKFKMIDLFAPESLEIIIDWDGKKVWVNGEDGCLLRAYRIKNLVLNDQRKLVEEN